MLAPEDDIKIDKKDVEYANLTFKRFESLVKNYKIVEQASMFLYALLVLTNAFSSYYIYNLVSTVQSSFEAHNELITILDGISWSLIVFALLFICCFQVYKSLDNLGDSYKVGFRFYFFQSFKILLFIFPMLNLFFIFGAIAFLRIVFVAYFSYSKSFK